MGSDFGIWLRGLGVGFGCGVAVVGFECGVVVKGDHRGQRVVAKRAKDGAINVEDFEHEQQVSSGVGFGVQSFGSLRSTGDDSLQFRGRNWEGRLLGRVKGQGQTVRVWGLAGGLKDAEEAACPASEISRISHTWAMHRTMRQAIQRDIQGYLAHKQPSHRADGGPRYMLL